MEEKRKPLQLVRLVTYGRMKVEHTVVLSQPRMKQMSQLLIAAVNKEGLFKIILKMVTSTRDECVININI
jgi:hypothetical protein